MKSLKQKYWHTCQSMDTDMKRKSKEALTRWALRATVIKIIREFIYETI